MGFFALGADRKDLKWRTTSETTRNDVDVSWNMFLIAKVLPKAYVEMFQYLRDNTSLNLAIDQVYGMLPDLRETDDNWQMLAKNTLLQVFEEKCVYSSGRESWILIKEAYFHDTERDDYKIAYAFLKLCRLPVVSVPMHIDDAIRKFELPFNSFTPSTVRNVVARKKKLLQELHNTEREGLLKYMLEFPKDILSLIGTPVLPLENDRFASPQKNHRNLKLFITTKEHSKDLVPGCEGSLIKTRIDKGLKEILTRIAGEQLCQIMMLDENGVSYLLKEVSTKLKVVMRQLPMLTCSWYQLIWNYINKHGILKNMEGLPIIPIGTDQKINEVAIIRRESLIIYSEKQRITYFRSMEGEDEVLNLLKELGFQVVHNLPSYVLQNKTVFDHYIFEYKDENLPKLLQNLRSKIGQNELIKRFSNIHNNIAKLALSKRLGRLPSYLNSDDPELIKALPMIENTLKQELVSVEFCRLVAPQNLPEKMPSEMLLKVNDNDQLSLIKELGGEQLRSDELIRRMLLPELERKRWLGDDDDMMIKYIFSQYLTSYGRRYDDIFERLKQIEFLMSDDGRRRRPHELFFRSETLVHLFRGEKGKFAAGKFVEGRRDIEVLQQLGLKDESDISSNDILCCLQNFGNIRNATYAKTKATVILNIVGSKQHLLRDGELVSQMRTTRWIPIMEERPYFYPKCLTWFAKTIKFPFVGLRDIYLQQHANLVGCVKTVCNPEFEKMDAFGHLKRPFQVEAEIVVDQLSQVIENYDNTDKQKFVIILKEIYRYLQESRRAVQLLKQPRFRNKSWVWVGDKFVMPHNVILDDYKLDLQPYLYALPSELKGRKPLLSECGAIEKADKNCLKDVLCAMKRSHDLQMQSTMRARQDKKMCQEILLDMSQMELSEDDFEQIMVPVYCNNNKLKLVPSSECFYCFPRNPFLMGGQCGKTFFLDDCISEDIAKRLRIKTYKSKVLGAESLMFEEYGQSEPLTKRISEILKDYGDGSAIFKELIQNADDAGATEVKFLYDERSNDDKKQHLVDPCMKDFQGPALWSYNNAEFSEEDFENLTKIGGATKANNRAKIGRFGLGFNAVYNITDVPSFISRNLLVILDPHTTNLPSVIRNKPGVKIPIDRLQNFKDQIKTYDGIFGVEVDFDENCGGFHGTLFRLPLRTMHQAQQSDIKKLFYSEREMKELLKKFASEADRLLMFTQNVTKVQLFHLQKNPKRVNEMQLLLSVSKTIFHPDLAGGILKAIELESFDIMSKSSEVIKQRSLSARKLGTEYRLRNIIDIVTRIEPKGTREFELKGACGKGTWFIHSLIDNKECMKMAIKDKGRGLNPVASVAIAIDEHLDGKAVMINETSINKVGYFFCFLPIPITNGLHVHINSTFALTRDRKSFQERAEDDKCPDTPESKWNCMLMSGPVASAYVSVLNDLTSFVHEVDEKSWYKLWPHWSAVEYNRHNKALARSFYGEIIESKGDVFPKLSVGRGWVSWSQIRIIQEAPKMQELIREVYPLFCREKFIVQVPQEIIETINNAGFFKELDKVKLCFEEFFTDIFMPNLEDCQLRKEVRDDILLLALQISPENDSISKAIIQNKCIPTIPLGELKRPDELVNPMGKAAKLFLKQDAVFPAEQFQEYYGILIQFGMVSDVISWQVLEKRAKTVKGLFADNQSEALKRTEVVLKTMKKNLEKKYDRQSATSISWGDLEFLPVKAKPSSWEHLHLEWKGGNSCGKLACAKELYPAKLQNAVGCHKLIVDERISRQMNKDIEALLGINLELKVDDLAVQAEMLSLSVSRYKNESTSHKSELHEELPRIFRSIYRNLYEMAEKDKRLEIEIKERLGEQTIILTKDNSLVSSKQVAFEVDFDAMPYLFELSDAARDYHQVMKMLNVKNTFGLENYQSALQNLKDDIQCQPLGEKQLRMVRSLLESIEKGRKIETDEIRSGAEICESQARKNEIFLPDKDGILQAIDEIIVKDTIWMTEDPSKKYLHESIPIELARNLGAKTERSDSISVQSRGLPFGQKEKLTVRLKKILEAYPSDVQILYELLQNADDAGASTVKMVLDKRTHPSDKIFGESWVPLQGPALLVYNNAPFTQRDIDSIQNLGEGSKSDDCRKIGQYGIGFNVVYHVTDAPCLLTKVENDSVLCVFDPHARFLKECTQEYPGRQFKDARNYLQRTFPDIYGTFLPVLFNNENSAIFRLPLRTEVEANRSSIKNSATTTESIMKMFQSFKSQGPEAIIFLRNVQSIDFYVYEDKGKPSLFTSIQRKMSKVAIESSKKLSDIYNSLAKDLKSRSQPEQDYGPHQLNIDLQNNGKGAKKWTVIQKCASIYSQEVKQSINHEYETGNLPLVPFGGIAHNNSEGKICGKVYCSLPLTVSSNLPIHINGNFILEYESRRRPCFRKEDSFQNDWNCYIIEGCIIPCYFELLKTLASRIVFKADKQNFEEILNKALSLEAIHPKPIESYFKYFPVLSQSGVSHEYEPILVNTFYRKLTKDEIDVMPVVRISSNKLLVKFLPPNTESEQFYIPDFLQELEYIRKQSPKICIALNDIGMNIYNVPLAIQNCFCEAETPLKKLTPKVIADFLRDNAKQILNGKAFLELKKSVFKEINTVNALLAYCMKDQKFELEGMPLLVTEDESLRVFQGSSHVFFSELSTLFPSKKSSTLHRELEIRLQKYESKESGPLRKFMLKDFSEVMESEISNKFKGYEIDTTDKKVLKALPSESWIRDVWSFISRSYEEWHRGCMAEEKARAKRSKEDPRSAEKMGVTLTEFLKPIANWCLFPVEKYNLCQNRKSPKNSFLIKISDASTSVIPGTDRVMTTLVKEIGLPVPSSSFNWCLNKLASPMNNAQALIAALKHESERCNSGFYNLSIETARDLLYYLNTQRRDFTRTEKQSLKELPIWKDILENLQCVASVRFVYLITEDIPHEGIDLLQKKYSAVFLKEDGYLRDLYTCIGLKLHCDSPAYCQVILKNFGDLQPQQREVHLEFLKRKVLFEYPVDSALLHLLHETKIIEKNGILSLARDFCDPEVELFKETFSEEEFPPDPYNTDDWLRFLRKIGLVSEVSADIFCSLTENISRVQEKACRRKESEALVKHLSTSEQLKNDQDFLKRLSKIPFLVAEEIDSKLCKIFPPKSGNDLLCFKGAMAYSDENIITTWTVKRILPQCTAELECEDVCDQLGIVEVQSRVIAENLVNVSQSKLLNDIAKGIKQYPKDQGETFRTIFKAAYESFSDCRDEDVISMLKRQPIILVKSRLLSVPKKVTQEQELDMPPYLFSLPPKLAVYAEFFEQVGMCRKPTFQQLVCVLSDMNSDAEGRPLNPNEIQNAYKVVEKLIKIVEDEEFPGEVKQLPLPGVYTKMDSNVCLYESQKLVYFDDVHLESRLTQLCRPRLHLGEQKFSSEKVKNFIVKLPPRLRPKMLSEFIEEKMIDGETVPNQGFADKLESRMNCDEFAQCMARILKHQIVNSSKENLDEIKDKFSRIKVITKIDLKTVLYQSDGTQVDGSESEKDVFIDNANRTLTIYIKSLIANEVNAACLITGAIVTHFCSDFKDPALSPLVTMLLLTEDRARLHDCLDSVGIWKSENEGDQRKRKVSFSLGDFVPLELHLSLKFEVEDFEIDEYVAYEREDPNGESVYIYAMIVEVHSEEFYKIDVGQEGEEIVHKTKLYGFHRAACLQKEDDDDDHTEKFNNLDDVKMSIRQELEEAFRKGNDYAKREIKRLWLKWHPDKNKDKEELCTEVFKFIQSESERIQNINSLDISVDIFWSSSSFKRNSQRFYHQRTKGFDSPYRRENPQPGEGRRWYRQSKCDLEAASSDLDGGNYEWACFKCHQAAEKSLKAAVYMKHYSPISHHFLRQIASTTNNSRLDRLAGQLESLLKSSSALRYPDRWLFPGIPHEKYDENMANEAIHIAQEIVNEVENIIETDC